MEWNETRLIDLFLANLKKNIILQELESSFTIQGKINSVEELELCSYSLYEVQIIKKKLNNIIYVTIHGGFIGINFENTLKKSKINSNKVRKKIPYKNLKVSLTN